MRWFQLSVGDHEFDYRLEKHHQKRGLIEVFESNDLNDILIEANSWVHCLTQYPPHLPPVVNSEEEAPAVWEDCMDEE